MAWGSKQAEESLSADPGVQSIFGMRVTPGRRLTFFLAADAFLVSASIFLALALRFDGNIPATALRTFPLIAAPAVAASISTLYVTGLYRVSWSYVGLRDVGRIALAVAIATVVTGGIVQLTHLVREIPAFPRSVVLIQAPITFCALSGFRLSKRAWRTVRGKRLAAQGPPTLLVGAGDAGAQVLKSIQLTGAPYNPRGFLDDDPLAHRTHILGVPVLGPISALEREVAKHRIEVVIISAASATSPFVQDVVRRARLAGVKTLRIVPALSELVDGQVTIESTRDVRLEDLLGREAVTIQPEEVSGLLAGKRVLVTGGAGTIGSELCRQVARFAPARLTILDVDETRLHDMHVDLTQEHPDLPLRQALVDVRDKKALAQLFAEEKPDIVFHAAAYKHVPMMELYPLAALEVNVLGTSQVVAAAEAAGCSRFILISTDKAVEPSSVMGASKRLAELVLFSKASSSRMIRSAVRFGNVIGSRGSVIPTFERQLAQGGPLTVTHPEIERYFMMTSEAVSLVLQAASLGKGNDVFVLDMGKPVRILDVAREFIRLKGLEPDVDVKIAITGLRPGEKLYESLTYATERTLSTTHPRILRVDSGTVYVPQNLMETVRGFVEGRDAEAAVAYLRHLFPTIAEAETAARAATTAVEKAPSA